MASNLETIGLGVSDRQEFEKLVTGLAEAAREGLPTPVGDYAVWRSRSGAEVWLHIGPADGDGENAAREIQGLTPFFNGTSDLTLNVTARINRPDDNAFEGAYQAWLCPPGAPAEGAASDEEGSYPIVFDAVDYAAFSTQNLPAQCRARICGFCRELTGFPDEATFSAAQKDGPDFAAQSFFPVGLFAEAAQAGATDKCPSSNALINGIVKSHRELVNEFTNQPFHWLEVESLDATYDILASPGVVKGEIVIGGVVQAACWLFGRILK
ncbi:MAG: hypothetical protein K0U74_05055 [Alphaproteobacteria bacterium]|nr:hypothetical protein [Alphaproteobacteria bacterium]